MKKTDFFSCEGWIKAESPIYHGGSEKNGSTPVLRTIYIYTDEGEVPLPYINGNAIRGRQRRYLMKDFFDLIGLPPESLQPKLYHVFFSGGNLEDLADGTSGCIDLELRRNIYRLVPSLSLMGCAIGNQVLKGKLQVGHAFPVCREFRDYLPDSLKKDKRASMHVKAFTDESFITRKDDLKITREQDENAIQMKIDFECFIPGTLFYHWFALEYATEIEMAAFCRMLELMRLSPFLGGMSAAGNGKFSFHYEPEPSGSEPYVSYVIDHAGEIQEFLLELEGRLGKKKRK
ncbi:MAG: hypothetical protein QW561_03825 [Candidatus Aenigmatarchaeota archaeon]